MILNPRAVEYIKPSRAGRLYLNLFARVLGLLILLARAVPSGILLLFTLLARVLGGLDSIVSRKGRALEEKSRSAFILSLPRFLEVKYSSAPPMRQALEDHQLHPLCPLCASLPSPSKG